MDALRSTVKRPLLRHGYGDGGQEYTEKVATLETYEKHQDLVSELIADVAAYNPDVDRELLARAFRFAAAAHEGQQRRSGEEFIAHPWSVAKIAAELRLDEETIVAALLHDVVEDTETEIDDVRAEFGEEVAHL